MECAFFMKRILGILIALSLFCISVSAAVFSEEEIDETPLETLPAAAGDVLDLCSRSAILIEQKTGEVLYESNPDEKLPIASVTKVMSLLLIAEALQSGKLKFDDVISCSDTAANMGGSQIWLEPNEKMTVDDLLKAVFIVSANDATVLLAEAVAGSEESFVALMNERAAELGLDGTHFENCTGLNAENHLSTARDVAKMSAELLKHDFVTKYSTVWMDTLRNGESELVNTNKLVRFYEGTTGLKTGTTEAAGYCLSASAVRKGLSLVAVVLGADTSPHRFADAQKLLNYGFAGFSFKEEHYITDTDTFLTVKGGTAEKVRVECTGSAEFLLKKGDENRTVSELCLPDSVEAPVSKGDVVGEVKIKIGDECVATLDVTAAEDVKKMTYPVAFLLLISSLFSL